MKKIPLKFDDGTFEYKHIMRTMDIACYKQRHIDSRTESYEVIIVQKDKEGNESYPTNTKWSEAGWTCHDLESSRKKMDELLKKSDK